MFYRVFGRSGSGKTEYVFDRLRECVENKKRAFLIVPEQGAVMTEKAVIEKLGNASNLYAEVINFKRLCNRVFRETGGLASKQLDKGARKLIMAQTLDEIADSLSEYSSCVHNKDFIEKALSGVNELTVCGVTPEELDKAALTLKKKGGHDETVRKISDLSLIARAYDAKLTQSTGVCPDIYERLCEAIAQSAFFADSAVFIDSFYGFTAQEKKVISYIAETADDIYVTILWDGREKDEVFTRSMDASNSCAKIADKTGCLLNDVYLTENRRHDNNRALFEFEKGFSSDILAMRGRPEKTYTGIRAIRCRDIYSEAKAACTIAQNLVRGGCSYSDICITAKNVGDYNGVIDSVFAKNNIPLGFEKPEVLSSSPLSELVLGALEAALTWEQSAILRYVKTGLSGLSDEQADTFETYVRTWNITKTLFSRDEDWHMNPEGYVESEPDEYVLGVVNSARSKVCTCIGSFSALLRESKTLRDFAQSVWALLCDIAGENGSETFDDKCGGIHLDLLCKMLDSMVNAGGDIKTTASGFSRLFTLCCGEYDTGHIPESADEVRFSSVDLVRASNVKYMIMLGLNDGIFPSRCRSGDLLSDSEKVLLSENGIRLSEGEKALAYDELFLAYAAVSSASKECYLLYSDETSDGTKLYPSAIVTSAVSLTGAAEENYPFASLAESQAGNEALFEEYMVMPEGKPRSTVGRYFSALDGYKERMESLSEAFHESESLESDTVSVLYSDTMITSYSKLEKFNECPFSHFCTYILRLSPEKKAALGAPEAGSIMHKTLELFVPRLARSKSDGKLMTEAQAKELITQLLEDYFERISYHGQNTSNRFKHLYSRLSKLLCALAVNLVKEMSVSEFIPCDFELSISDSAEVKPVPVDLGDGHTLKIIGQIDRVDRYDKDGKCYIRIIDYKTGSKSFKLDNIMAGFNLQMLLYLYSICKNGSEKYGKPIVPAGVLYTNVTNPDTKEDLGYDDEVVRESSVPKAKCSGMLINDTDILLAMDPSGSGDLIPVKIENGEASAKYNAVPIEKMGELLNFACDTAAELAKEMYSGYKAIKPFRNSDIDACRFCDMLPVCAGQAEPARNSRLCC